MEGETKESEINSNLITGRQLKEKKKLSFEEADKAAEEMRGAFNRVFNTCDGKLLGKWLIENCGVSETSVVVFNGKIGTDFLIYNEARRGVYLELRKFLSVDTLINLEIKKE